MNQELIAEILDGMGYEVIVAESGEVAVDLAERTRFAAILMDRRLPGIDGLEASLRIGEAAGGSPPPIILVTADISTAAPDDARWRYIRAFVTKPVDWRHLQETLNGVIK